MTREQRVSSAFVALADTYDAEFDALSLFHGLVKHSVSLLDVEAAGVLLEDGRGGLRVMASSSDEADLLEILQLQSESGPCMDCWRDGVPVLATDLEREKERWPELVPFALAFGYRSLYTAPLRLQDRVVGAINLFRAETGPPPEADRHLAQALADVATLALMHSSTEAPRPDDVLTRVQGAVSAKTTFEMAKGMLAQFAGVSPGEAAAMLRTYTRLRRVRLTDTVLALVSRALNPQEVREAVSAAEGRV
jgi:transcriptional regulator with GAF, ATPase, and Fis domain